MRRFGRGALAVLMVVSCNHTSERAPLAAQGSERLLAGAKTLEDLAAMDDPSGALCSPDVAVDFLPRIDLAPPLVLQVQRGQSVWVPNLSNPRPAGVCRAHAGNGDLIGIGELTGNLFRPTKTLAIERG